MCRGAAGEKETRKNQRSNQGGFWPHTKELGCYSACDRELLKPKTTLIKSSVCVCMHVFQKLINTWSGGYPGNKRS